MGLIRGIITSMAEGAIKRFGASGRANESFEDREFFQHYGFSSCPLAGAEGIIINEGNHIVMIASDDRRYRVGLKPGEVCLYTDEGDVVHLKHGKEIHVKSGGKVITEAPLVHLKTDAVTMEGYTAGQTPTVTFAANIHVDGNIEATGSIIDGTGNTNHHSH